MPSDVRIMSLEKYLLSSIGKNNDDSVSVRKIDSTLMISTDKGAISVEECEANQWEIKYFHFDHNLKVNDEISKDLKGRYLEAGEGKQIYAFYFNKILAYEKALDISLYLLSRILPDKNLN